MIGSLVNPSITWTVRVRDMVRVRVSGRVMMIISLNNNFKWNDSFQSG
jgi:hypothetical protein